MLINIGMMIYIVSKGDNNQKVYFFKNTPNEVFLLTEENNEKVIEKIDNIHYMEGVVTESFSQAIILKVNDESYMVDTSKAIPVGKKIIVFYSEISPNEIWPREFKEQYGYVVLNK